MWYLGAWFSDGFVSMELDSTSLEVCSTLNDSMVLWLYYSMISNGEVWRKGKERPQLNSFGCAECMWSVNQLINLSAGNALAYTDQNLPAGSASETLQLSRELQTVNLKNMKKQSSE